MLRTSIGISSSDIKTFWLETNSQRKNASRKAPIKRPNCWRVGKEINDKDSLPGKGLCPIR